jgi:hypothetical protein
VVVTDHIGEGLPESLLEQLHRFFLRSFDVFADLFLRVVDDTVDLLSYAEQGQIAQHCRDSLVALVEQTDRIDWYFEFVAFFVGLDGDGDCFGYHTSGRGWRT